MKNLQIARNYLPSPGKLTFTYTSYFTAEHFDGHVHSLSVLSFAGISCSVTIYWGGWGGGQVVEVFICASGVIKESSSPPHLFTIVGNVVWY